MPVTVHRHVSDKSHDALVSRICFSGAPRHSSAAAPRSPEEGRARLSSDAHDALQARASYYRLQDVLGATDDSAVLHRRVLLLARRVAAGPRCVAGWRG